MSLVKRQSLTYNNIQPKLTQTGMCMFFVSLNIHFWWYIFWSHCFNVTENLILLNDSLSHILGSPIRWPEVKKCCYPESRCNLKICKNKIQENNVWSLLQEINGAPDGNLWLIFQKSIDKVQCFYEPYHKFLSCQFKIYYLVMGRKQKNKCQEIISRGCLMWIKSLGRQGLEK